VSSHVFAFMYTQPYSDCWYNCTTNEVNQKHVYFDSSCLETKKWYEKAKSSFLNSNVLGDKTEQHRWMYFIFFQTHQKYVNIFYSNAFLILKWQKEIKITYIFLTFHYTLSLNNRSLKYILQKGQRLQDICTFDVVHLPCNNLLHFCTFAFCQVQETILQKILSIQVNPTLQSTNTDQNYICLTSFSAKPPKLIFGTTAQNTFLTQHLIVDHSSHTTTCSLCRKCNLYEETK
jgi:hypothetical protein